MGEKSVAWRASEGVVGREGQIIPSVRETSGKVIREVVSKGLPVNHLSIHYLTGKLFGHNPVVGRRIPCYIYSKLKSKMTEKS